MASKKDFVSASTTSLRFNPPIAAGGFLTVDSTDARRNFDNVPEIFRALAASGIMINTFSTYLLRLPRGSPFSIQVPSHQALHFFHGYNLR